MSPNWCFFLKPSISLWPKAVPCGKCEKTELQLGHMRHAPLSLSGSPSKGPWLCHTESSSWPSVQKQENEGSEGWAHGSVAEHSIACQSHEFHAQHFKTNKRRAEGLDWGPTQSLLLCTVRQRQVNAAVQLLAQCKQMTRLTSALKGRHLLSHTSGKHSVMPSVP